jgi:hypothetical protein
MKTDRVRGKASGQSLPLIALMIVVLVAMVGLAVDVGNTYAEQRNTVRSSNAAALAGMTNLINGGDDTSVYNTIVHSLNSNNIQVAQGAEPQSGERVLVANYLDASGNPLAACPTVGSNCPAAALNGTTYIRVNVSGLVDTYFARVVNRPTLPVGANAWAKRGACTSGIYPIAIRDSYLGSNGFVNSEGTYSDANYRNKTIKTIEMHDPVNNPSGGFDWLRWSSDAGDQERGTTAAATEAMLTGPGNIAGGFDEAPWPSSNSLNLPQPAGYPLTPDQLSPGDWLYPNTGVSNASGIRQQLDWHIQNKTVMILPIWDTTVGSGNTAEYHSSRMGAFILLDYDLNGHGSFKLAYIGNAGECATLITNVPPTTNLGITGQVLFRPHDRVVPASRPPVEYEIVLDVSGSMSWTFAGYGSKNGNPILCTGVNAGCDGPHNYWRTESERRIYVAKQAIKAFIGQLQTNDIMRIVAFSGGPAHPIGNQSAINDLTKVWPATDWSSNHTTLNSAVDSAGAYNNNTYITDGLTPSAAGLAAGNQVLAAAPTQAADGQTYKRVVIFLTDGVANVFRDGSLPSYDNGCGPDIASCNVGYTTNGVAKPITAMGSEADSLKQLATIYVIALANVDDTGLTNVASAPNYPYYSTSEDGSNLQGIFSNIVTNVKYGTCVPAGGNSWADTMTDTQVGDVTPPLTFPTVGTVYLYDQNGHALPNGQGQAPIQVNPQSGKLVYHFDNLAPGTYQLKAFVAYKGSDDLSRIYDQIFNQNTATSDNQMTFSISGSNTLGNVIPMDKLYLDMSGSVCPTP